MDKDIDNLNTESLGASEEEFQTFFESVRTTGSKRKSAYKLIPDLVPKLTFEQILEIVPIFHDIISDGQDANITHLIGNLLHVIKRLYVSENEEYRIQAMNLVAPLTELSMNGPKSIRKPTVKCLKKVVPMLNEEDFRGYIFNVAKQLLLDDDDYQNQQHGLILIDAMLPRLKDEEKINLLLPKLPDLLVSKEAPLRKSAIKTYSLLAKQLSVDYVDGLIVPAIVCGANDKDLNVRRKTASVIGEIAQIGNESKSNLIRPFFNLVQDANKQNANLCLKEIPTFLGILGKEMCNKYSKFILPILVNLSQDTVRLYPDAPSSIGQALISIINFYMDTETETILQIIKNLSVSGAVVARFCVGNSFQYFMKYVKNKELTDFFLDVYDSLLKDTKLIQLSAITSLPDIITIVSEEKKNHYMKAFMGLMEDPFWRVRYQLASTFSGVIKAVGESLQIQQHLFQLLNDQMAATRSKAAEVCAEIFFIASDEFKEKITENFITLSNGNYHRRKVIIEFISWYFGLVETLEKGLNEMEKFYMNFLYERVDDPIANVRIHLCHAINLIGSKFEEFVKLEKVKEIMNKLVSDEDDDVKEVANGFFKKYI